MKNNTGVLNPLRKRVRDDSLFMVKETEISDTVYRVAIPEWFPDDGIAKMIEYELQLLGHEAVKFSFNSTIPKGVDILLTFAPYNKVLRVWEEAAQMNNSHRPIVIHWNTEGLPDLRIPMPAIKLLARLRSKLGRMGYSNSQIDRFLYKLPLFNWVDNEMMRFRHYGDYEYAYHKGWLHLLFDTSKIYSAIRSKNGLPTEYAPWGSSRIYYQDLGLQRDIDVLWMGDRGSMRRNRILNYVTRELVQRGFKVHIADNIANPFIFDDERTKYLNRSKITLNITRTWYDDNFSRFSIAAPNRSMVVSEPMLPHCPEYEENVHYVSAEIMDLPETIIYYLEHDNERQQIADNAYHLMTTKLRFSNNLQRMLQAASQYRNGKAQVKE